MISFRLTADEYDRFREMCSTCGIRSVSELARTAINSLLNQCERVPRESLEYQVAALESRVNMLTAEVKRMRERDAQESLAKAVAHVS